MENLTFSTSLERKTQQLRDKLKVKLQQIQRKTESIEQVGSLIVQELCRQELQMDDINDHLSQTATKLDDSKVLVRKAFGGFISLPSFYPKRAARPSAAPQSSTSAKVVLELERLSLTTRRWTSVGVYDESFTVVTAFSQSVSSDPSLSLQVDPHSRFTDSDGWTYGTKMCPKSRWGEPRWNTFYRKRVWRRKSFVAGSETFKEGMEAIVAGKRMHTRERATSRGQEHQHRRGLARTRSRTTSSAAGPSSANACTKNQEELEADEEMDEALDRIAEGLDNAAGYAREIRDELRVHERKIEMMDKNMQQVLETELVIVRQMKTRV